MIKILVLASAFVLSASAFAMPTVGDDAVYAVTATQSGQTFTGTIEYKLVSESPTGSWDEQITTAISGQTSTQDQAVMTASLLTDAQVQQIVSACASAGGSAVSITVPAGTFNTCALPASSGTSTGTIWIADVTFGIVKEDVTDSSTGQHTIFELQSQTSGQ